LVTATDLTMTRVNSSERMPDASRRWAIHQNPQRKDNRKQDKPNSFAFYEFNPIFAWDGGKRAFSVGAFSGRFQFLP
jgi:hypothetical protein